MFPGVRIDSVLTVHDHPPVPPGRSSPLNPRPLRGSRRIPRRSRCSCLPASRTWRALSRTSMTKRTSMAVAGRCSPFSRRPPASRHSVTGAGGGGLARAGRRLHHLPAATRADEGRSVVGGLLRSSGRHHFGPNSKSDACSETPSRSRCSSSRPAGVARADDRFSSAIRDLWPVRTTRDDRRVPRRNRLDRGSLPQPRRRPRADRFLLVPGVERHVRGRSTRGLRRQPAPRHRLPRRPFRPELPVVVGQTGNANNSRLCRRRRPPPGDRSSRSRRATYPLVRSFAPPRIPRTGPTRTTGSGMPKATSWSGRRWGRRWWICLRASPLRCRPGGEHIRWVPALLLESWPNHALSTSRAHVFAGKSHSAS